MTVSRVGYEDALGDAVQFRKDDFVGRCCKLRADSQIGDGMEVLPHKVVFQRISLHRPAMFAVTDQLTGRGNRYEIDAAGWERTEQSRRLE